MTDQLQMLIMGFDFYGVVSNDMFFFVATKEEQITWSQIYAVWCITSVVTIHSRANQITVYCLIVFSQDYLMMSVYQEHEQWDVFQLASQLLNDANIKLSLLNPISPQLTGSHWQLIDTRSHCMGTFLWADGNDQRGDQPCFLVHEIILTFL